ncbi:MAG: slipin family protein [Candidatus Obscuribacterales bacterium]|nr:slipin family protein [Candidatus Obscuribacterales bacterium]
MQALILLLLIALIIFGLNRLWKKLIRLETVYEYQVGLLYKDGKLVKTLTAGRHLIFPPRQNLRLFDTRKLTLSVSNQEILCIDNLSLKLSATIVYRIDNASLVTNSSSNYIDLLHLDIQMILRDLITPLKLEEVLRKRNELTSEFTTKMQKEAERLGIVVEKGTIRDIVFPPEIKRIYSLVAQAEKEGQASLAKARGEMAALRSLANASRLLDDHPSLLALRTLQQLGETGGRSGNGQTIVLAIPGLTPSINSQQLVPAQSKAEGKNL